MPLSGPERQGEREEKIRIDYCHTLQRLWVEKYHNICSYLCDKLPLICGIMESLIDKKEEELLHCFIFLEGGGR